MAPKRRSAKKGKTRMDAALDAMLAYGFPNKLVRSTVKNLLNVYGGNDGWVFIEDSSYSVLIEALLEKQANPLASPQHDLIEANPGDSLAEGTPTGCLCSNSVDTVSATSEIGSALLFKPVDIQSVTSEPANQLLIGAASETPIKAVAISAVKESECQPAGNWALGKYTGPRSPQLLMTLHRKKRRPCYGWISNDDDEDEELIQLPANPCSDSYARENNGVN